MPEPITRIEIRIRDRVGVVSEVTREITALGIPIAAHKAHVSRDARGQAISVFRADLPTDDAGLDRLRQRCSRIKGFLSFSKRGEAPKSRTLS